MFARVLALCSLVLPIACAEEGLSEAEAREAWSSVEEVLLHFVTPERGDVWECDDGGTVTYTWSDYLEFDECIIRRLDSENIKIHGGLDYTVTIDTDGGGWTATRTLVGAVSFSMLADGRCDVDITSALTWIGDIRSTSYTGTVCGFDASILSE